MADKFDLVIIGAGPGGYEAAIDAAKKGFKTALVENRELGGTCLNRGCIPTKTILHTAELYHELENGEKIGLRAEHVSCDMEAVQNRKEEVLEQLRSGIAMLMKNGKISVCRGLGTILTPHKVKVSGEDEMILETDRILIATGSVPAVPSIEGAKLPGVVTSDELLDKRGLFDHLIVIGGGVIGMEFASIYSSLGKKVTVVEALDRILANMDKEISQNLKMILKKRGVDIHTGAKVEQILSAGNGKLICRYTEKDQTVETEADGILVAVGRKANTDGLFGDGFQVKTDRGKIVVDENYQTGVEHVYAVGDVTGGIQLAHMAAAEGRNAVSHMAGESPKIDTGVVPACVYTNPEIGAVGITADEAKQAGLSVKTMKYGMSANGKSILSLQERGFIKVVADKESGRILGAQMMCARATDMISEFAVAVSRGLTVEEMASVIRPHPTFSEGITEVMR